MNESQNPSALRSKQQIIDALLKLMDIYPYKEISVKQIILETDLVRKTFYRNFSSKDDVLDAYINSRIFEYTQALLDQDNPLDVIFAFCDKNRQMLELLQKNDMLHILLKRLIRMAKLSRFGINLRHILRSQRIKKNMKHFMSSQKNGMRSFLKMADMN